MEPLAARLGREFVEVRARTVEILGLLAPDAYVDQIVWQRYPPCFFDGHVDAFVWTRIFRDLLGRASPRPDLDDLFFRGIAPATPEEGRRLASRAWPSREEIASYKESVRRALFEYLERADLERAEEELLRGGWAFRAALEHEAMHQETILFTMQRLPYAKKRKPEGARPAGTGPAPAPRTVEVPDGTALLGARPGEFPYGWDNEFDAFEVRVPAFGIDAYDVTNGDFLEFVGAGGYGRREWWSERGWDWARKTGAEHPSHWERRGSEWVYRGFFEEQPLPLSWPVYSTYEEAAAFARFSGGALPTEAQWHRAAFGEEQARPHPWGDAPPGPERGNFDFRYWSPVRVGAFPAGAGPLGVEDMVGNGLEWTSTPLGPFPGFRTSKLYPNYSTDFFDGEHYVLKGASPFTPARLVRRSFRTWFRWDYPHAYAAFRRVYRGS